VGAVGAAGRARQRAAWLAAAVCTALLLACSLGAGLVAVGAIDPPELAVGVGPFGIAGGRTVELSCPEPWVGCDSLVRPPEGHALYTVWLIYPSGRRAHQYGHLTLRFPLPK
jgi:hypothetical protein